MQTSDPRLHRLSLTSLVTRGWNKLPPSVVQRSTIDSFKDRLDRFAASFSLTLADDVQVLAAF